MKELQRKLRHVHPKSEDYKGGLTDVTFCARCYVVALDKDASACRHCGGMLYNDLTAVWVDTTPKFDVLSPTTWNAKKSGKWHLTPFSRKRVLGIASGPVSEGPPSRSLNFSNYDPYDLDFTK